MTRIRTALATSAALTILLTIPGLGRAQTPIIHEKEVVTVKATIKAIDHDTRMITFANKAGETETVYASPEIRRFAELKVGDVVTFRTTESIVYQIRKPGEPGQPSVKDEPVIVRIPDAKPAGAIMQQETKTVTVKAVDTKMSSVTIATEDGKTASFKVNDTKLLNGLKAGDRVVMTYTAAVAISVE